MRAADSAMDTGIEGLFAAGDFADHPGEVWMITAAVAEGSTTTAAAERVLMSGGLEKAA